MKDVQDAFWLQQAVKRTIDTGTAYVQFMLDVDGQMHARLLSAEEIVRVTSPSPPAQPPTGLQKISQWFEEGVKQGARYMLVAVDTFDHTDYPIYVHSIKELHDKLAEYHTKPMDNVLEVYDLHANKDEQLSEKRVWRVPK